ncbi:MAG: site-specific DNA-methyltransferase [Sedimentisphaerales bacterium]|nr:site-specific DNA-methyltransferase [Sedimentisphaerales bacterium]
MLADNREPKLIWAGKEPREPMGNWRLRERGNGDLGKVGLEAGAGEGNMLIWGDNRAALAALGGQWRGKVKCVYVDPPFNTGTSPGPYPDAMDHAGWLTMMRDRLELVRELMSDEGMIFIHLDDSEAAYLKVLSDEIFGRDNFLNQICWERSAVAGLGQGGKFLVNVTEYLLVYAKDYGKLGGQRPRMWVPFSKKTLRGYRRVMTTAGERELVDRFAAKSTGEPVEIYRHKDYEVGSISWAASRGAKEIAAEYEEKFDKVFRTFLVQRENSFQHDLLGRMEGGGLYSVDYVPSRGKKAGQQTTNYYLNKELVAWLADIAEVRDGAIIKNQRLGDFWTREMISNAARKEGAVSFDRSKKPEKLMQVIIEGCTEKGDWVLDPFAGSGTTGAVAHKLGRRWIMIEQGEHCGTHIWPRMKRVVDGSDGSGISKAVDWRGGGGFGCYEVVVAE